MTYQQAIKAGYKPADTKLQRGYVSRKINVNNQPVIEAGGRRKGELYVELPSWQSTVYCIRQYLTKD